MSDKMQFLHIVYESLKENPEWLSDMLDIATQGIQSRVDDTRKELCEAYKAMAVLETGKSPNKETTNDVAAAFTKSFFNGRQKKYTAKDVERMLLSSNEKE